MSQSKIKTEEFLNAVNNVHLRAGKKLSNYEKRILFCDIEQIVIEIDSHLLLNNSVDDEELVVLKSELCALSESSTRLSKIQRGKVNILIRIYEEIDQVIRMVSLWLFLVFSAIFIAFPSILLRPIDSILMYFQLINTRWQITCMGKWFIANFFIKLGGNHLVVERHPEVEELFGKKSALVCFTHASSLDAFILAAAVPVKHFSLAKSDLFLIPFFSWSLLAFGGIPVNRDNRDQAIKSLSKAARLAKTGDCVAVAPEGTRSLNGQMNPFKKGPFYLWEQLQTPIIPMVTFGAYDLCPPGNQVPVRGKIYVQLLKPIYPHEAKTRDEMSTLVRSRMLQAIRDGPLDVGVNLTASQRVENVLLVAMLYCSVVVICTVLWLYVPLSAWLEAVGVGNIWLGVLMFLGVSVVITLLVYFYIMYVTYWIDAVQESVNCCSGGSSNKGTYCVLSTVENDAMTETQREAGRESEALNCEEGRGDTSALSGGGSSAAGVTKYGAI